MKVVVNATPLIALSLVNRLDLLHGLFERVIAPLAVYEEITVKSIDYPGVTALRSAAWIEVMSPQASPTIEPLLLGLDMGELQVLLLSREIDPDWVLMDERLGRRVAKAMGLPVKGTVGVLLAAFYAGLLSKSEALGIVHRLVVEGIRIGPRVIAWFEDELNTNPL